MAEQDQRALATEVLELGEQLFALALEERAGQQASEGDEALALPLDEIEAASREFFAALRLLLNIEQARQI